MSRPFPTSPHPPRTSIRGEIAGEELEHLTSTHFRKKLRYYRRALEREGGISLETPTAASLDDFMTTLFDLHAARWKKRGLPGMLAADVDQSFHREVARGMPRPGHCACMRCA